VVIVPNNETLVSQRPGAPSRSGAPRSQARSDRLADRAEISIEATGANALTPERVADLPTGSSAGNSTRATDASGPTETHARDVRALRHESGAGMSTRAIVGSDMKREDPEELRLSVETDVTKEDARRSADMVAATREQRDPTAIFKKSEGVSRKGGAIQRVLGVQRRIACQAVTDVGSTTFSFARGDGARPPI